MSPEEWAGKQAGVEKVMAKGASTRPVQAEHYGVAAGLLAAAKQDNDAREAIRLLTYGPRYRGEALRRFSDGIRVGELMYKAVTDYVDGSTDNTWREHAHGEE